MTESDTTSDQEHEVTAVPIVKMEGIIGYSWRCSCGRSTTGHHKTPEKAVEAGREHFAKCYYCERPFTGEYPMIPTRDHVIPRAAGGTKDPANIVTACRMCNQYKGDRTDIGKGSLVGHWSEEETRAMANRRRNRLPS